MKHSKLSVDGEDTRLHRTYLREVGSAISLESDLIMTTFSVRSSEVNVLVGLHYKRSDV